MIFAISLPTAGLLPPSTVKATTKKEQYETY
ncbi:hypothetical protein CFU_1060 [Collimonas fungivorans Ter331]|uniref:Uncharacterized protein n=1 Tax=Collimonas fungivorans (strain Ter331) TaxID=1005048 RepID=G0AIV9_COLFT|nr:hypothetical protein CFU_1060 [Collimonas fungivorans Ter331]